MIIEFPGKTAVVTGGGSGIGQAVCENLSQAGANVIVADINIDNAQKVANNIGTNAKSVYLNVSDESSWEELFSAIEQIDYLVNAAGIGMAGNFEDFPAEFWDTIFSVNLKGVFLGCKHAIRKMRRSKMPSAIVNMSSIGGLVGTADLAAYNASKAGVTSLTKSIALHCASEKLDIRCNAVHPSVVDSPMLDPIAEAFPSREAMLAHMAADNPLGRVVTTEEVANSVLFLLSDLTAMINGSGLTIDGAQLAGLPSAHSPENN